MGRHKEKHQAKIAQQLINRQENQLYYQRGAEQKHERSDAERALHRKPPKE